jgi:hypothetical protein
VNFSFTHDLASPRREQSQYIEPSPTQRDGLFLFRELFIRFRRSFCPRALSWILVLLITPTEEDPIEVKAFIDRHKVARGQLADTCGNGAMFASGSFAGLGGGERQCQAFETAVRRKL